MVWFRFAVVIGAAAIAAASENRASAQDAPKGEAGFFQTFDGLKEGQLPKGWSGDASVGAHQHGDQMCIEAVDKGEYVVQSPKIEFSEAFQLDVHASLEFSNVGLIYDPKLEIVIKGREGSQDVKVAIVQYPGSWLEFPGKAKWEVVLNEKTRKEVGGSRGRNAIRITKDGDTFQVLVNNQTVIARRLPEHQAFDRLEIGMTGPSDARGSSVARVFSIAVKPTGTGPASERDRQPR